MKNVEYKNADEISGVLLYEDCFFRKRKHFSFEKEVRVSLDTYLRLNPTKDTPYGYELPIFPSGLIQKVLIHPDSSKWFFDAVNSITTKYELHAPIEKVFMGIRNLTMQIHADKFPQRPFVANATSLTSLQFAGDLRRYVKAIYGVIST